MTVFSQERIDGKCIEQVYIKQEMKSNIGTLCDLSSLMSEVCALGEIFVKLLFSSLPLYTSLSGQKSSNVLTHIET